MNKIIAPLAIAAALAIPAAAHADDSTPAPTASATIGCERFAVDVAGLQTGDRLVVEQGSQAPYGFVMGSGVYWQFAVDEAAGTAHTVLEAATSSTGWFSADIGVIHDHIWLPLFHQMVNCGAARDAPTPEIDPTLPAVTADSTPVDTEPIAEAAPESAPAPVPIVVELDVFAGVALAPPW